MGNARGLIRRYRKKTTEEEREQFREEHPEIDAVLEIVSDIDIKYGTKKQKELDRKSTRLNSSHPLSSRMPSSA